MVRNCIGKGDQTVQFPTRGDCCHDQGPSCPMWMALICFLQCQFAIFQLFGVCGRNVSDRFRGKNPDDFGYVNQYGLSRKVGPTLALIVFLEVASMLISPQYSIQHIFDSVKASLKRLQLEYIDLFQCTGNLPNLRCSEKT